MITRSSSPQAPLILIRDSEWEGRTQTSVINQNLILCAVLAVPLSTIVEAVFEVISNASSEPGLNYRNGGNTGPTVERATRQRIGDNG